MLNRLFSVSFFSVAIAILFIDASSVYGISMLSIEDSGFEIQGSNIQDNVNPSTSPWYLPSSGGGAEAEATSVVIANTSNTGLNTIPVGVNGDHALRLGFKYDAVSVRNNTSHIVDSSRTYTLQLRAAATDTHAGPYSQGFQGIFNVNNATNVVAQGFNATDEFQTFSVDITPAQLVAHNGKDIQIRLFKGAGTPDFAWIDDVKLFASTPTDVSGDQTQSVNGIEVFEENTITLASDLTVDALNVAGATVGPNAAINTGVLGEGKTVTSHFVHFDPDATSGGVTANGVFTFDDPIVGLIFNTNSLNTTDDLLGLAGVTYASDGGVTAFRGALNEGTDTAIISADGRTIDITLLVGTGQRGAVDQFRILTMEHVVPEPATATLAMLGLGGLMIRRRRLA
jgi:hypothetical protein